VLSAGSSECCLQAWAVCLHALAPRLQAGLLLLALLHLLQNLPLLPGSHRAPLRLHASSSLPMRRDSAAPLPVRAAAHSPPASPRPRAARGTFWSSLVGPLAHASFESASCRLARLPGPSLGRPAAWGTPSTAQTAQKGRRGGLKAANTPAPSLGRPLAWEGHQASPEPQGVGGKKRRGWSRLQILQVLHWEAYQAWEAPGRGGHRMECGHGALQVCQGTRGWGLLVAPLMDLAL